MVQTKALYNHLLYNGDEISDEVEPWMIESLRPLPIDEIFKRLEFFGIHLDRKTYIGYAEECDTPEAMAELLIDEDKEPPEYDEIYLLLFELWRRFLPEKSTLSIFCDEFDFQVDQYYKNELDSDEPIQDGLANLADILEEHVDAKMKPKAAFELISEYCSTDLEVFLYDYISDLLDQENQLYAQELIDEFSPYFPKNLSFEFLKARLLSLSDPYEANRKVEPILAKKPSVELLFNILQFIVTNGEHALLQKAIKQLLPQLTAEEEFEDVVELVAEYFRRLDKDELESKALAILEKRKPEKEGLKPSDPDYRKLEALLNL